MLLFLFQCWPHIEIENNCSYDQDGLVSLSPSPTLEFYGTLSPIPGARLDMTSPAPPNPSGSGAPQHIDESMPVRLQTPTEVAFSHAVFSL